MGKHIHRVKRVKAAGRIHNIPIVPLKAVVLAKNGLTEVEGTTVYFPTAGA